MQQIYVGEQIIAYQSHSASPAKGSLLFIHGSGGDHHKWNGLMAELPPGFTGVSIDLPGHGASSGPLLESIDEAAGLVSKLPALLNLPRPVFLVGHSMGAAIAITIALDYSDSIDGIILIGGGSRLRVLPAMLEALQSGQRDPEFLRLGFAPGTPAAIVESEISAYQQVPVEVLYNDFNACDHFDRSRDIAAISLPTLLIVGENDKLAPVKYSQFLQEKIGGSILEVIPAAGHYVMLEKGSETAQVIRQFADR